MLQITLTDNSVMLIDDEDHHLATSRQWINTRGHAAFSAYGKSIYFARELLNAPEGLDVDHIDGNTLNNQKSNLRLATRSQNLCNRTKTKANTSGYKGVFANGQGYMARIIFDKKKHYLGTFPTPELAAKAYDEKAKVLHGEFAKLNFPNE
jgi:hypothetical protein